MKGARVRIMNHLGNYEHYGKHKQFIFSFFPFVWQYTGLKATLKVLISVSYVGLKWHNRN